MALRSPRTRAGAPRATAGFWLRLAFALVLTNCEPASPPNSSPAPTTTATASRTPAPHKSSTPGPTGVPTETPTPSPSPSPQPRSGPTLGKFNTPVETQVTAIPTPLPRLDLEEDIVNILLLGSDQREDDSGYHTDTLIVASINKAAGSVTLLSIPRDLFVYIPGWKMQRINTADIHGAQIEYPGGGPALLEQTLLYNLGLPIHYYARIQFDGFKRVVDTLGGIDVPVACDLTDWRIKSPDLDPNDTDNYEEFTLTAGVQHMDGSLALWYARSRLSTSDFDRARRQQQVLRAIFAKGMSLGVAPRLPQLYQQFGDLVATDMGLGDVLQFAPLAAEIYGDELRIKSRFIGANETIPWTTSDGAAVRLPDPDRIQALLAEAFQPPASNRLRRAAQKVELWNGTTNPDLAALALDRLIWEGFDVIVRTPDATDYAQTTVVNFRTSDKSSRIPDLKRIYRLADAQIIAQPDVNATVDYRVIIGADYNACTFWFPPSSGTPAPTDEAPTDTPMPPGP